MTHPRSAFGASPSRGHRQRTGKAGSAAVAWSTGMLLFAHGARDAGWAAPFEEVATAVRNARPTQPVRLAYLEFMAPDIRSAALELVAEGCTHIDVLPLFLGAGGHVRKDLPPLLNELRAAHAGVGFTLHPAVGESPALIAAMTDIALALRTP